MFQRTKHGKAIRRNNFEGNPEVAEAFVDDNPLANSSNLEIYMKDISKQDDLVTYIESLDKVRKVNRSDSVASMLTDSTDWSVMCRLQLSGCCWQ